MASTSGRVECHESIAAGREEGTARAHSVYAFTNTPCMGAATMRQMVLYVSVATFAEIRFGIELIKDAILITVRASNSGNANIVVSVPRLTNDQ